MKRKYTKTEITKKGKLITFLREGVKKVTIGDDVWTIGRKTILDNRYHCVIYGPDNKQYHVFDNVANNLHGSYCSRQGNTAIEKYVKVYILTSILDVINNWEFDLKKIPSIGKLKVILENGTVKNIDFNGEFFPQELISKRYTRKEYMGDYYGKTYSYSDRTFKNIVGYRKN